MISFRQYIEEMAARNQERALKLLGYIHSKQKSKGLTGRDPDQMTNIVPRARERPNVSYMDLEMHFEYSGSKPRDVPVHTIISGQRTVSKNVVSQKVAGTWKQHDPEYPWMIQHRGVHYLLDGNHRVAQARLKGEKHIKAMVYDVPDHVDMPMRKYDQGS